MHLTLMFAVLGALALAESAPHQPVDGQTWRLAGACGGMLLVAGLALGASWLTAVGLRRDATRRSVLLRRFRRFQRAHAVLWLAVAGAVLYWLDWGQLVRANWHLDRAFLVDDILVLTPVVLPLLLSWAAFYDVYRAAQVGPPGEGPRARPVVGRRRYVVLHLRHYAGLLLVPVLVLLAVQDAARLLGAERLEGYRAVLVFAPAIALLLVLFPILLRFVWETRPLPPGPLRERLEETARRSGLPIGEILVWGTGGMGLNAAVTGLVRPFRYVLLSDGLLQRLSEQEIVAVFGHELGHVRHFHLPLRVMTIVAPVSVWLLVRQAAPEIAGQFMALLSAQGAAVQASVAVLATAAATAYMLVVFGCYSRLLEHQADLFGCRWVSSNPEFPAVETFSRALEKMASESGISRNMRTWQHGSIARRIEFLRRMSQQRGRELHFHGWLRLASSAVAGIVISPLVFHVLLG